VGTGWDAEPEPTQRKVRRPATEGIKNKKGMVGVGGGEGGYEKIHGRGLE
jgi:hypothetical protein